MACSCNEPATALMLSTPNPARRVNYAKGMVLGVDDFVQEATYVIGRQRWLASDALGYGTLSGLRLFAESAGSDGPRLHVSAGSALAPSGALICVPADQCCVLNRWLAKPENAREVLRLVGAGSPPVSPPIAQPPPGTSGVISLYVTLCFAECTTEPVPIPGEPCRSEDELMADSRIADDFRLELRTEAPAHWEEGAVRDFVAWLRTGVQVVDTVSSPAGDHVAWRGALRAAVQPWIAAFDASPPLSPQPSPASLGDFLFDVSPPAITVGRAELCAFLRLAVGFWVTELRPWWHARACGRPAGRDDDCLLLARMEFPVIWVGGSPSGAWQVDGDESAVSIDERARPILAHARLLQEWLLCGCDCGAGAGAALPSMAGPLNPVPLGAGAGFGATSVPLVSVTGDLTLDGSHHVVLTDGGPLLTLPKAALDNRGRIYVIKSVGTATRLAPTGADEIDGVSRKTVKKGSALTVVSDGLKNWHVIGMAE